MVMRSCLVMLLLGFTFTASSSLAEPCVDEPDDPPPSRDEDTHEIPSSDVTIGDVVCMGGREVWRDPEGRLRVCTVAKAVTLNGIDIAAEAYTHFHANGHPDQTTLARPQALQTASNLDVPCAAAFVSLSDTGKVTHCELETPMSIGGVACRAGESVAFHEDGSLWGATIDAPVEALATTFEAETRLQWHPTGEVAGGWLPKAKTVAGYPIRWEFTAFASGRLHTFDLAEPREVAGHPFPERSKIWLRRDGSLQRAEYISDQGFMLHGEQWTDTLHLRFDCDGQQISAKTERWQSTVRKDKFRKP